MLKEYSLLPIIDNDEIKRRYKKIIPCRIIDNNVFKIKKTKYKNIKTDPFLFNIKKKKIGTIESNGDIRLLKQNRDHNLFYKKITTIPTLHTFIKPNMFIPTLYEIICQLPKEVFNYNKIFIIIIFEHTVGDFHIGRTLINLKR